MEDNIKNLTPRLQTIKKTLYNDQVSFDESILDVLSLTESWIDLDQLKEILPQEQYNDLCSKLEAIIKFGISKQNDRVNDNNGTVLSAAQIEEYSKNEMNSERFFFTKRENTYGLVRYMEHIVDESVFFSVDLNSINHDEFPYIARAVLKKHRDYDRFWGNESLSGPEMREALDMTLEYIDSKFNIPSDNIVSNNVTAENKLEELSDNDLENMDSSLDTELKDLSEKLDNLKRIKLISSIKNKMIKRAEIQAEINNLENNHNDEE